MATLTVTVAYWSPDPLLICVCSAPDPQKAFARFYKGLETARRGPHCFGFFEKPCPKHAVQTRFSLNSSSETLSFWVVVRAAVVVSCIFGTATGVRFDDDFWMIRLSPDVVEGCYRMAEMQGMPHFSNEDQDNEAVHQFACFELLGVRLAMASILRTAPPTTLQQC